MIAERAGSLLGSECGIGSLLTGISGRYLW